MTDAGIPTIGIYNKLIASNITLPEYTTAIFYVDLTVASGYDLKVPANSDVRIIR